MAARRRAVAREAEVERAAAVVQGGGGGVWWWGGVGGGSGCVGDERDNRGGNRPSLYLLVLLTDEGRARQGLRERAGARRRRTGDLMWDSGPDDKEKEGGAGVRYREK